MAYMALGGKIGSNLSIRRSRSIFAAYCHRSDFYSVVNNCWYVSPLFESFPGGTIVHR